MEMEAGQEIYLKNVTQIGTPGRSGKVYIADSAYARIHMDEFQDMRVFVLMGHTECDSGKYTTFIEAAIPVEDMTFIRDTPVWTNKVWNRVYQEIRRAWESLIIVGWAMDRRGIAPRATAELEAVHREYFGGAHQVLFLSDTDAQEEFFYLCRNNHLYAKDGFYIYYSMGRRREAQPAVELELPSETRFSSHRTYREDEGHTSWATEKATAPDADADMKNQEKKAHTEGTRTGTSTREQYREMLAAQQHRRARSGGGFSAVAVMLALVLLAAIVVTAVQKNPQSAERLNTFIETISSGVSGQTDEQADTEESEVIIRFSTETSVIPVEEVDGGIADD